MPFSFIDDEHYQSISAFSAARTAAAVCGVCGRQYSNKRTMRAHMKLHQGLTTCLVCHKVICTVEHLRRHLLVEHALTPEQVKRMTTVSGGAGGSARQGRQAGSDLVRSDQQAYRGASAPYSEQLHQAASATHDSEQ